MPDATMSVSGSVFRLLLLIGRILLGAIFVYAAFTKLHIQGQWHLGDYSFLLAMAIDSYHILPAWAVLPAAKILPWFELTLGLLLLLGVGLRCIATLASVLLAVFFAAMLRAHLQGLEINCGCFGPGEKLGVETLIRDGALLGISLAVTVGAFAMRPKSRLPRPPSVLPD